MHLIAGLTQPISNYSTIWLASCRSLQGCVLFTIDSLATAIPDSRRESSKGLVSKAALKFKFCSAVDKKVIYWTFWSKNAKISKQQCGFFKKIMKGRGCSPRLLVTDKLPSYNAASKALLICFRRSVLDHSAVG